MPAYQALKTALNALTVAFATLLSDTTITVTSVCPPGEFVARIAWDTDRVTGEFLDRDGPLPW
ncbi:MAG TPA: hypothetical protein VGL88_13720 [Pseudonocardiaceae bacterium]